MRETLLILRKDADRRRWLLAAFLALVVVRMTLDILLPRHSGLLPAQSILGLAMLVAAVGLIYDAVQQERIVGDTQYWLTRPLPRGSILAAKGLFLLLFIVLPALLAGWVAVAANGVTPPLVPPFPLAVLLAGAFVWSAASVTRTTVEFVLVAVCCATLVALSSALLEHLFGYESNWGSAQTVRDAATAVVFVAIVAAVIPLQYRRRATAISRPVLFCGALLCIFGLPGWHAAFSLLEALHGPGPGAGIALAFDSTRSAETSAGGWYNPTTSDAVGVRIPIAITGVSRMTYLLAERSRITVATPDGQTWNSGWRLSGGIVEKTGFQGMLARFAGARALTVAAPHWLELNVDRAFYDRAKLSDTPVRVIATAAFTTLKGSIAGSMPIPSTAHRMGNGELCSVSIPERTNLVITCLSASNDDPLEYTYRLTDGTHSAVIGLGSTVAGLSAWSVTSTSIGSLDLGEPRFDQPLRPLFTGPTRVELERQRATGYFERTLIIDGIRLGPYEVGRSGPRRILW